MKIRSELLLEAVSAFEAALEMDSGNAALWLRAGRAHASLSGVAAEATAFGEVVSKCGKRGVTSSCSLAAARPFVCHACDVNDECTIRPACTACLARRAQPHRSHGDATTRPRL